MSTNQKAAEIVGVERVAINDRQDSVHGEQNAKKFGFRGPAIAASMHLDIFGPVLVEAYGQEFYERGAVSFYSMNVVVSGERVQAVAERPDPPGSQTRVYARRGEDHSVIVCAGTGSLGDHSRSELKVRDLRLCDDNELRILRGAKPGLRIGTSQYVIDGAKQLDRIRGGGINEATTWHTERSPWGGPIATLSSTAGMMVSVNVDFETFRLAQVLPGLNDAKGMSGAFEVAYENGPVFLDRWYTVEGVVVGAGQSPTTEYFWWDATARDEKGVVVARMRHMQRLLKASSPLYPELAMA